MYMRDLDREGAAAKNLPGCSHEVHTSTGGVRSDHQALCRFSVNQAFQN